MFFSPSVLQQTARRFSAGFPGLVTYAVKANPDAEVLTNLAAAGVGAFDVASPDEIARVRQTVPGAALHYNNPVRSSQEIAAGSEAGVASWAVDSGSELDKLLARISRDAEIAVRFKLPVPGGAYDFGTKFGAPPDRAAELLRRVADAGFRTALTFHPGTQCTRPDAWASYIAAAADIASAARLRIRRLNVGGGFPSHRGSDAPALETIFDAIRNSTAAAFGPKPPELLCEPGRGLVADAFVLAASVKAVRDDGAVFLDDGIYGALAEMPLIGVPSRIAVLDARGCPRTGHAQGRIVFGPTCDSLDRLPGEVPLPADIAEGDHVLVYGMGAYAAVTSTRFNGFGALRTVTVQRLA